MAVFGGFPDPKSNFTAIQNLFFDQVLPDLKEAELKVFLYITRHTSGWQKAIDGISLSQFERGITTKSGKRLNRGTGLARSTIVEALKSLIEKGYVLRFIPGRGSQRLSYYCLNTPRNRMLIQTLESGKMTIEEVLEMESGRKTLGSNFQPTLGSEFKPSKGGRPGSNFGPTKEGLKNNKQKKAPATGKPSSATELPYQETDEYVREQALIRKRRQEISTGGIIRLKDVLLNLPVGKDDAATPGKDL